MLQVCVFGLQSILGEIKKTYLFLKQISLIISNKAKVENILIHVLLTLLRQSVDYSLIYLYFIMKAFLCQWGFGKCSFQFAKKSLSHGKIRQGMRSRYFLRFNFSSGIFFSSFLNVSPRGFFSFSGFSE